MRLAYTFLAERRSKKDFGGSHIGYGGIAIG
jgi:hypothetical protein